MLVEKNILIAFNHALSLTESKVLIVAMEGLINVL
jgi:hypothetical protein